MSKSLLLFEDHFWLELWCGAKELKIVQIKSVLDTDQNNICFQFVGFSPFLQEWTYMDMLM